MKGPTFGGEMQKIYFFFSLDIAKEIPMERQVGNAGGTVIVTRSKLLRMTSLRERNPSFIPLSMKGIATKNPNTEIAASTAINLSESV